MSDGEKDNGKKRRFFDPDKVAAAAAAAAAALHGQDDGLVEELARTSLQGELDRIASLNEVRRRYGQPTMDAVSIGALFHSCDPNSYKPWSPPDHAIQYGGYWTCEKDNRGCYFCYWVEYRQVAVEAS